MKENNGKTAVITGGTSGIGFALAKKLLAEGFNVTITSRSGKVNDLEHPNLRVVQLEITKLYSIGTAAKEIAEQTGKIDILINNAGIATDAYYIVPEYESFKDTIDTNLTGLVFFTEAVIAQVKDGGHIINISTDMGLLSQAQQNGPGYRISKAAVNMYTKMLSQRMAERKIRVTAAHPGWVKTNVGGEDAPMDAQWSANGLYQLICDTKRTGEFRNIYTEDCFLL